jgi:chromosome segregation ATPase
MCKKFGIAALGIVLGLGLLSMTAVGRKVGGLFSTLCHRAATTANNAIPLDLEIERLEREVTALTHDIDQNHNTLAEEMVAVKRLKTNIEVAQKNLKDRLAGLELMNKELESARSLVAVRDRERLEAKFARDWEGYKAAETNLKSQEALLEQKQELVDAARAKIDAMRSQQEQLKLKLAELRTNLEQVRLAETQAAIPVDEGRLSDIKKDIANVEDRLEVQKYKLDLRGQAATEPLPIEEKVKLQKAREEFKNRFGNGAADKIAEK